jgi:iron complex outermembrane receptor protein
MIPSFEPSPRRLCVCGWVGLLTNQSIRRSVVLAVLALQLFPPETRGQSASGDSGSGIEEIIVTAQKRSERAQDVPVALTVLTAAKLDEFGVTSIQRLSDVDPNVSLEAAQSFQRDSLSIRGIGTIGNSRSFEGAVGVFVDGVYRTRTGMVLGDLLDIGRLEVLRGPQGTLFGKNTVAGTLSLFSTQPSLHDLGGDFSLQLGAYNEVLMSGAANVPIGEAGGLRVAGVYHTREGFFKSPDNGDFYDSIDRYGFKTQYLYRPSNRLEVLLVADYAHSKGNCCWSAALAVNGPTVPLIATYASLNGLTFVPAPTAERDRIESLNTASREEIEDKGLMARVTWQFPKATLTSITSVRDWSHAQIDADADFSPADIFVLDEPATIGTFSEEVNLTMPIGPANLLLGFYYATEDYASLRTVKTGHDADNYLNALTSISAGATECLPPLIAVDCLFPTGVSALLQDGEFAQEHYQQRTYNRALFAHSSTDITDRFTLVAGLRYSVDDKSGGVDTLYWYDSAIARAVLAAFGVPDNGTPRNGLDLIGTYYSPSFHADIRDETTTGTASLQYRWSDRVMLYGGYHRGYKAGGVNLFREGAITETTYAPEYASGTEIGMKADYWDGRARTNVAIFDTRFSDLQINFFTGLEFKTENVGEATTKGIEIENLLQVNEQILLGLSLTRLDAKFGVLDNPSLSYLNNRAMPKSPDWAATANVTFTKRLPNQMTLLTRGLLSYTGKHYVGAEIPDETPADAYVLADVSVGVQTPDKRWEFSVWCTNCTDQNYRTVFFNTTFQPGSYSAYLGAPKQYGVSVRATF